MGWHDYYYCIGRQGQTYFPNTRYGDSAIYNTTYRIGVPTYYPSSDVGSDQAHFYYRFIEPRYFTTISRYYYAYMADRSYSVPQYANVTNGIGESFYEHWTATFDHPFLSYDFYLYRTYTTKTSGISSTIHGTEFEYRAWWDYETRTNWYIDSNNNIQYYNSPQVKITNDTNAYRTS